TENVGLRFDMFRIARRVGRHVVIQESLEVPRVELKPVDEGEKTQNDFPLDKPRLGRGASPDLSPIGFVFEFPQQVIKRSTVYTVTEFLFIEDHRATVQAFENLITQVGVAPGIDDDAPDCCVENLRLMLLW